MSVVRASTIGVILGCILYAAYLLIFREIDANTFEKLQEEIHSPFGLHDNRNSPINLHRDSINKLQTEISTLKTAKPTAASEQRSTGSDVDGTKEYNKHQQSQQPQQHKHHHHHHRGHDGSHVRASMTEATGISLQEQGQEFRAGDPAALSRSTTVKEQCVHLLRSFGVIPGSSWGTLSTDKQRYWKMARCDDHVQEEVSFLPSLDPEPNSSTGAGPGSSSGTSGHFVVDSLPALEAGKLEAASSAPLTAAEEAAIEKLLLEEDTVPQGGRDKSKGKEKGKGDERKSTGKSGKKSKSKERPGLATVTKDNTEWCNEAKRKYDVRPMKSWGSLPINYIDSWKKRGCDVVFTTQRLGLRPLSSCISLEQQQAQALASQAKANASGSTWGAWGWSNAAVGGTGGGGGGGDASSIGKDGGNGANKLGPDPEQLPLIAVMAATTTRKIKNPSTSKLALFTYLLPSLIRTVDCGFRYEYVLGYDKGDPFYDSMQGVGDVKKWFKENIEEPMRRNGISMKLRLVKVNNTLKKPGPVFLEMARAAYRAGAEYFYRINDDTELLENWPKKFTEAIKSIPAPYGAVGPLCNQGNQKILTHDFVHRTHMEIFEMNYYPPELTDWWMDDWISLVYGQDRTLKAQKVPVIHHTGAHGQRYQVDQSHAQLLKGLVVEGRKKIRHWMLTHNVPETDLQRFDSDEYKAGFKHKDIPN